MGETVQVVLDRLTQVAGHIASKHGLKLHAFDGTEEPSSIVLSHGNFLNPAPVTPFDGSVESPFSVLAGTSRAIYGKELVVTPGIMTGNTDTRFFWDLTKHIFRFAPGYDPEDTQGLGSIHTVNERVSVVNRMCIPLRDLSSFLFSLRLIHWSWRLLLNYRSTQKSKDFQVAISPTSSTLREVLMLTLLILS